MPEECVVTWRQVAEADLASIIDYIFRWMELRFLGGAPTALLAAPKPVAKSANRGKSKLPALPAMTPAERTERDNPRHSLAGGTSTGIGCPECGSILYFSEGCFVCKSCGYTRC